VPILVSVASVADAEPGREEPPPSVPQPPDTPSPPATPPPAHPPAPEHPFLPGDPTPPATPAPPPAVPDAPFVPGDPTPAPPSPAPPPPAGPAQPSAAGAGVPERIAAARFGGRIIAEAGVSPAAADALDALMLRIDGLIARSPDAAAQREIAELVALVPRLERPQNASLVAIADRAVTALAQSPPQVELAAQLRAAIRRTSRGTDNLFRRLRFTTPSVRVLLGLAVFLVVVMPLILLAVEPLVQHALDKKLSPEQVVMVGIAGAFGSIISIMVRIQDFDRSSTPDPASQVFVGAFRPVIGIGFALFGYVAVKAGILPIGVPAEQAPYFFAALAFLCGFSERLANDLVAKTEQSLAEAIRGNPAQPEVTPGPTAAPGSPPPAAAAKVDPPS
jgi:hypothetical protein